MRPKTIQTSEYCTVGHPDRTCDFIASHILDRYLAVDRRSRVALEVQLKDAHCTISGEVTSNADFDQYDMADFAREAVHEIGYTPEYQERFGGANAICDTDLEVETHISRQSGDIAQGVNRDGWGDQGIFWGMAVNDPQRGYMPKDYWLARKVAQSLCERGFGGLDVKTQVTVEDGLPVECVVAIPILPECEEAATGTIRNFVQSMLGSDCRVIVNGTGRYVTHGSIGDCGTTGRKLVADFYGGNSKIGGGSPWGKDPTKADVTLNILARDRALAYLREHNLDEVHCAISCCIGRSEIRVSFFDGRGECLESRVENDPPSHIIDRLGLREPGYAGVCVEGLFGYERFA